MSDGELLAQQFEADRGRLRAVAYRMLGSHSETDDAVQEAWLRLSRADTSTVENLTGIFIFGLWTPSIKCASPSFSSGPFWTLPGSSPRKRVCLSPWPLATSGMHWQSISRTPHPVRPCDQPNVWQQRAATVPRRHWQRRQPA